MSGGDTDILVFKPTSPVVSDPLLDFQNSSSDKQNGVYTTIILRVICNLSVFPCIGHSKKKITFFYHKSQQPNETCTGGSWNPNQWQQKDNLTPYNFPSRCNETQLTDIYLKFEKKKKKCKPTTSNFALPQWIISINLKEDNSTSMTVPFVITPREVYIWPLGFFFTPIISRLKVHLSSGCVTWALVNRSPLGRMKRSYFGGFLVKPAPTNVAFVIILFHCLAAKEIQA